MLEAGESSGVAGAVIRAETGGYAQRRPHHWRGSGGMCLNRGCKRLGPEATSEAREEKNLTPDQVEALDKRRDLGHTFLVIAGQFAVIAMILLLWVGQDLTYSPGWAHPIAYYFAIAVAIIAVFGVAGYLLRRGTPRLD